MREVKMPDVATRVTEYGRARWSVAPDAGSDPDDYEIDAGRRAELLATAESDPGRLVFGHTGRLLHKWTHYPDVYERYLAALRGTPLRFLEIGVSEGGSLQLWREYFGPEATIVGVDVDPACAGRVDPPNVVRIGSQADPAFLRSVVAEMGGVDVVLDDGSHVASHQRVTFETLFPLLSDDGLYLTEDLHTSYWPGPWEGGIRRRGTAIEVLKTVVDDLHGWYHGKGSGLVRAEQVRAVHFYDSIAVVEKARRPRPAHIKLT